MTVIVFRPGGIVHTHEDVAYIETDSYGSRPPTLILKGYDYSEIASIEGWLKIEVLP